MPTSLLVVDMLSNNFNTIERIFLPLVLSYIVPDNTDPLIAIIKIGEEFISNPIEAGLNYWFWFVMLAGLIFFISVIYKNFKSGNSG